jgi:hypothetical protein
MTSGRTSAGTKKRQLEELKTFVQKNDILYNAVASVLARVLYAPLIEEHLADLPDKLPHYVLAVQRRQQGYGARER